MKRFLVRLFALGILVAAGVIAFAQSQRGRAEGQGTADADAFDPFQGAEARIHGPADPFAGVPAPTRPSTTERSDSRLLEEPRRLPPEGEHAGQEAFPSTRLISHQEPSADGTRSALRNRPEVDPFATARNHDTNARFAESSESAPQENPAPRTSGLPSGAVHAGSPPRTGDEARDPFDYRRPTTTSDDETTAYDRSQPAPPVSERYPHGPQRGASPVSGEVDSGDYDPTSRQAGGAAPESELRPTPADPYNDRGRSLPGESVGPAAPSPRMASSRGATTAELGSAPPEAQFRGEPAPFPAGPGEVGPGPSPLPLAGSEGGYAPGSTGLEGTGRPGDRGLEGAQVPAILVQKLAPAEVQVGKPATFEILVRNVGKVTARNVQVRDAVPKGTQFIGATPPAQVLPEGELLWTLDILRPDDERVVKMELMPTTEGEIGSVATVTFAAEASVRSLATRPELRVEIESPNQVMIGEDVTFKIRISNPGTGPATGVVLSEHVPPGLQHAAGGVLEYEVGNLMPNESRELELTLRATKAGRVANIIHARAEGTLRAEGRAQLEVISPALEVTLTGPKKRYLERQATYTIEVANPGTAPAKDVSLVTYIPKGFKFVNADNYGDYDPKEGAVYWSLEKLPPNQRGVVTLNLLPVETGQHMLAVEGRAAHDLAARNEQAVTVEGVSAILFQVLDVADPVEVGAETAYEIRVVNQGSKTATQIELNVTLPPELKPLSADGPTAGHIQGNQVFFEPLGALAPRADTTYRVRVRGERPGDLRTEVQLKTAEMDQPVTKEESTRVYLDQ